MHFSVEKSGKEVGSGQRFSHLKCIEFITYSQTTAAIPPAPPIATLAPYLFPGGEGSRFPMLLRCFDPPPPFLPTFYIVNKARNQAMMERDIELEYRRNEKSRVYHFPLPFIDFTSNRILSPLVTDLSLLPLLSIPFCIVRPIEKKFLEV